MKKVTIKEVAEKAGVSISTVSNALNPQSKKVSAEKRAEILQLVEEMGYYPSSSAQSLSSNRRVKIGLFIKNSGTFEAENSINMQIIYHFNKIANEQNLDLINIFSTKNNDESYEMILNNIQRNGLTHLIIFGLDKEDSIIEKLNKINIIKIYIDMPINNSTSSFLSIDNYEAQKDLLKYANCQQSKNLVYVTGDLESYVGIERFRAVKSFCKKNAVDLQVLEGDFQQKTGYELIKTIDLTPEMVISCGCDTTAMGVIEFLQEENLNNLVLGFDGLELMKYISKNFISVRQRIDLMALKTFENIGQDELKSDVVNYEIVDWRS